MAPNKNPLAIGTSSLGLHPSHDLPSKLHAAASHHFTGVEIVHSDLVAYSKTLSLPLSSAATKVRSLCRDLDLTILSLCPFENFEGSPAPLKSRLENASDWLEVARHLGAIHLQVPAQFSHDASTDINVIIDELRQLCDLAVGSPDNGQEYPIIIAYEPMSWSSPNSTWQSMLPLLKALSASCPNFKICIDTFHIATVLWASPYTSSGKHDNADNALTDSLNAFVKTFPLDKLAYIQLSDGRRFNPSWREPNEDILFSWSKNGRPFPGEGFLPVKQMVKSWIWEMGFQGWISMESFDWKMRDAGVTVESCAERAEKSVRGLGFGGSGGRSNL